MTSEVNQVELTDQELEQVMGGSGGGGGGGASVGTVATTGGSAGSSAGVQATGVGSGVISIGAGIGVAKSLEVSGPGGDIQAGIAQGLAIGGGVG